MPHHGTYTSQPFTLTDAITGVALNITGWTFKAELKTAISDLVAALTLTSVNGGFAILDAVNGRVQMNIDLTQAPGNALVAGKYVFDVLRTDVVPGPTWLFGGTMVIKPTVSVDG